MSKPAPRVPIKNNRGYWEPKLARNSERDAEQTSFLEADGWTVARFWEHQQQEEVAAVIRALVLERNGRHVFGSPLAI